MSFFRRTDILIRCACRGTTLAVPDRDALLDACEQRQRRRLQLSQAKEAADPRAWSVQWEKSVGDALRPHDIVAVLRRGEVTVELVCALRGHLAEMLIERRCLLHSSEGLRVQRRRTERPRMKRRRTLSFEAEHEVLS